MPMHPTVLAMGLQLLPQRWVSLPCWLIKTLGHWSRNCYTSYMYIRIPASILKTVPVQLAAIHSTPLQDWHPSIIGPCYVVLIFAIKYLAVFGT